MSKKLNRRQFITCSFATGAAILTDSLLASSHAKSDGGLSERVKLGKTGIEVSRLGLGTGTRGWEGVSDQTKLGTLKFTRLIRHALDRGINYFDAADIYGTHFYLRAALKGIPREQYVLQTKIWYRTSQGAKQDLDRFLTELQTDYIDVIFIHCVTEGTWAVDLPEMMETLASAKEKKIVRAHGISIHSLDAMQSCIKNPWVDITLCRINPKGARMDAVPDKVVPILRQLHDAGKAVVGIKILGEGTITDSREESLRYVLGLGCVDSMVIGFETREQIDEILAIGKRCLIS